MSDIYEQINLYKEKILQSQYEISNEIEHQLTKGELREKYIRNLIEKDVPGVKTYNGILAYGRNQSPQIDLIVLKDGAILNDVNVFDVKNVRKVFEIKSKMKLEHVRKINNTLKILKDNNSEIKGGIICYELDCTEQYLLKKFGFYYDTDLKSYFVADDNTYEFNSIDYVISFDKNNEFILSRDISGKFVLDKKIPIIAKFLMIFSCGEENNND